MFTVHKLSTEWHKNSLLLGWGRWRVLACSGVLMALMSGCASENGVQPMAQQPETNPLLDTNFESLAFSNSEDKERFSCLAASIARQTNDRGFKYNRPSQYRGTLVTNWCKGVATEDTKKCTQGLTNLAALTEFRGTEVKALYSAMNTIENAFEGVTEQYIYHPEVGNSEQTIGATLTRDRKSEVGLDVFTLVFYPFNEERRQQPLFPIADEVELKVGDYLISQPTNATADAQLQLLLSSQSAFYNEVRRRYEGLIAEADALFTNAANCVGDPPCSPVSLDNGQLAQFNFSYQWLKSSLEILNQKHREMYDLLTRLYQDPACS